MMAGTIFFRIWKSSKHGLCDHYWQAACLSHHAGQLSGLQIQQQTKFSLASVQLQHQAKLSISSSQQQQQESINYSSLSHIHGLQCNLLLQSAGNKLPINSTRMYSTPQRSSSFFGKILDNLKEESQRNTEMKKNIEEFKKDMEELSKSDTVTKAREKFKKIEEETAQGSLKARQHIDKIKQRVSQTVEDAQNIEIIQKASRMTEGAREKVQQVGQNISQKGEELSKTQTYQAIKEEVQASRLLGGSTRVYRRPTTLRRRSERNPEADQRVMEANTEATGVVLHKDSRFSQSWQEFRDNNPYVNRVLEWKTKFDESDHFVVRTSALVKDKITELFGPVFHQTDLSKTLTEICKMDPDFNKDTFLLEIEYDLIPNILEAMLRPDFEILKDWTYERAYSIAVAEAKHNSTLGHHTETQVLDLDHIELAMGKMLDEGPVLAVTFQAQVTHCTRNISTGEIVEGDPAQTLRRHYVWVFCRDQTELDPRAAWKLLEYTFQSVTQLV
uniref:Mitochondrial import inner membrane translocase subunit TIM44 n=2 Tax=Hirondellea gigas TaxID=1518452 RepID=A0A2P2I3G0_9CRUS